MKALLIGPDNPVTRTGQFLAPPLGCYRIASWCGEDVDVCDPNIDSLDAALSHPYDIIGVSMLHPTLERDITTAHLAHERQPDALLIAGGQGAGFNSRLLLEKTPIRLVARDYGEATLAALLDGCDPDDAPGAMTLTATNRSHRYFQSYAMGFDFSRVPFERYWERVANRYDDTWQQSMGVRGQMRTIRMMTSNYCPVGCTFCSSTNFIDGPLEQLSAGQIIEQMRVAASAHPAVESFYFNDDDFLLDRRRRESFLEMVTGMPYNLMCMGRVTDVDEGLLSRMHDAGFSQVFYGVESFSDPVIKAMRKGGSGYGERAVRAIQGTIDAGMTAQMALLLFTPHTQESDLRVTIDTAVDLMERGARVTAFPTIDAYTGSVMAREQNVTYRSFSVRGEKFTIPWSVLPHPSMREVASFVKQRTDIPQPLAVLRLFRSIYQLFGWDHRHILHARETEKRRIERDSISAAS